MINTGAVQRNKRHAAAVLDVVDPDLVDTALHLNPHRNDRCRPASRYGFRDVLGSDRVEGGSGRAYVRSRGGTLFCERLYGDRRDTRRVRVAASRSEFPCRRSRRLAAAANFIVTGSLYCIAAHGLARSSRPGGPRVVPVLTFGAGGGLICSGLFVTDPVAGYPPSPSDHDQPDRTPPVAPSRAGRLHNVSAIPIFFGIPIAALTSARSAARRGEYRWASYSAGSAVAMMTTSVLFGAAFGGAPRFEAYGGVLQRVSITAGFGWLSALSLGALRSARRASR